MKKKVLFFCLNVPVIKEMAHLFNYLFTVFQGGVFQMGCYVCLNILT